ncbi:MAG: hypothetical protein AAGA30_02870 [Planctomycetota bacterium]
MKIWIYLIFVLFLPVSISASWAMEETNDDPKLKILSHVYLGDEKEPVSTNLTLFVDRQVFDFRFNGAETQQPIEIVIFDRRLKKFVLLDCNRQWKLEVDELQLLRIVDGLRAELKDKPAMQSILFDDCSEEFNLDNHEVILKNDTIEYQMTGIKPTNKTVLPIYFEFLNQYTKLSATNPHSSLPPFARLKLNQSIKKFGLLPASVSLKVQPIGTRNWALKLSSSHKNDYVFDENDRSKIQEAKNYWTRFQNVSLSKFREIESADLDSTVKR